MFVQHSWIPAFAGMTIWLRDERKKGPPDGDPSWQHPDTARYSAATEGRPDRAIANSPSS